MKKKSERTRKSKKIGWLTKCHRRNLKEQEKVRKSEKGKVTEMQSVYQEDRFTENKCQEENGVRTKWQEILHMTNQPDVIGSL